MEKIKQEVWLLWKCCPNGQWHSYNTVDFGLKLVLCLVCVMVWKILGMVWDVALLSYGFIMTLLSVLAFWNEDEIIQKNTSSTCSHQRLSGVPWALLSLSESLQSSFRFFYHFFFFRFSSGTLKDYEILEFWRALGQFWTLQVWDIFFVVTILIYQELKWAERRERALIKTTDFYLGISLID